MEKESFYFPHFCNARHDRKIRRLRRELGLEGYGIYFMLLETLREQHDLRYPMEDVDLLADEFGTSDQKIQAVITRYDLFDIDQDQQFFSPRLLIYLEPYFRMKEQRKLAGQRSAEARKLNDRSTAVQQSKGKEKKEKESKVKEISVAPAVLSFRDQLFERWFAYKREKKNTYTETGKKVLIDKWANYSDIELEKAIERSISNNWSGLFEEKITQANPLQTRGKIQAGIENITSATTDLINDIQDGNFINPFENY